MVAMIASGWRRKQKAMCFAVMNAPTKYLTRGRQRIMDKRNNIEDAAGIFLLAWMACMVILICIRITW
tara:strand:- start:757 stop:960 length:204 start_codon:yes stop_codon:yes gene_type:complete